MPTLQFSYPYNDTDTYTLFFDGSPANATFNPDAPLLDNPTPRRVRCETSDGSMYEYTLGTTGRTITLNWKALPEGDDASGNTALTGYLGLVAFLEGASDFGSNAFGYYDENGSAELKVKYVSGIETFRKGIGSYYSGSITLKKVLV